MADRDSQELDRASSSSTGRTVAYYSGAAASRSCMVYTPEDIPTSAVTHINYLSAYISASYTVVAMNSGDQALWTRTTNLKSASPELQIFLSIGGWEFNNSPTQGIFSALVASSANTQAFIASALQTLETYGFDGIDIDWQFPGAADRGGSSADKANYVNFMAAVKAAFDSHGYGLTFTAPSSTYYLQNFDLAGLLKSANWVNVLAFDLHGVWDGADPSVGTGLRAHSNLTLIDAGLQQFWQANVNPSQIVLGFAFYGRTFTLANNDCFYPGCSWFSGGGAGPCSHNAGTLMYSELDATIDNAVGVGAFDATAAINYITYDDNQWASYDEAESFAIKINYANQHCLGGTAIWSIDQDDPNSSGLQALYPNFPTPPNEIGTIAQEDQCSITSCGANSCHAGAVVVSTLTTNPASPGIICPANSPALLCCPASSAPASCTWRGGQTTPCSPTCNAGETVFATDPAGNGTQCLYGTQALCCTTETQIPSSVCTYQGCSGGATCPSTQQSPSTLQTVVIQGPSPAQICPLGQTEALCCSEPQVDQRTELRAQYLMRIVHGLGHLRSLDIVTDQQGDSSQPCSGTGSRAYCCDPAGTNFESIPLNWIWNTTEFTPGPDSVTIELDPDVAYVSDSGNGQGQASSTWSGPEDGNPNDEPFGAIFIDSPNEASVSSMTTASDWIITSCNRTSDQAQQVLAYCRKPMDDASTGCGHVFIGQAEHTIIKLPSSCGAGPYGRVNTLTVHPDQDILSPYHASQKPDSEPVYLLSFDYEFAEIPDSNGPVYMRIDASDIPGYWDSFVNSPTAAQKRDVNEDEPWNEPHFLEKRGLWDDFKKWANKINTITAESNNQRSFQWQDRYTIFSQRESCPGPPAMESSMDISVAGLAVLNTRYGFYAKGTIIPPNIDTAYVYFAADALAQATFTIQGQASLRYDSTKVKLLTVGFPGLSYPGLITVGPSLVVSGYITGSLSIGGKFEISSRYQFPTSQIVLGRSSSDSIPGSIAPSFPPLSTAAPTINWRVDLNGNLALHLIPQLQLGISVLNGRLIDAQAYVAADVYAGVSITGSVSNSQAASFCINPYFGVSLVAGVQGSLAYWQSGPIQWTLYSNQFNYPVGGWCWASQSQRDLVKRLGDPTEFTPFPPTLMDYSDNDFDIIDEPKAQIVETVNGASRTIYPTSRSGFMDYQEEESGLEKRGGVPFLPGNLFCPNTGKNVGLGNVDYDPYSDINDNTLEDAYMRKKRADTGESALALSALEDTTNPLESSGSAHITPVSLRTVTAQSCNLQITLPAYDTTTIQGYYDFANAGSWDAVYKLYKPDPPVSGGKYAREHVYEAQLLAQFIDTLPGMTTLWSGSQTFPAWASRFLNRVYSDPTYTVIQKLGRCLPANKASDTDLHGTAATSMVMLEAITNGLKALSAANKSLRTQTTYTKYGVNKRAGYARAVGANLRPLSIIADSAEAAGINNYYNQGIVKDHFLAAHECVNAVWWTWAQKYFADTGTGAPGKGSLSANWGTQKSNVYTRWAISEVNSLQAQTKSSLSDFATWWGTTAVNVQLDFAINLQGATPTGAGSKMVAGADITALANAMPAISWVGSL
ncbi:hypothetical protein SISSUDRAFT_1120964 [Sistotremastrum suecicum HHB10207 ss-3]|uniref:GH18 domain-containing protein n=1 Tax=Sistotremastrum suecicum HHB10207 ss-3 TaxID=1314776 RepID=A0A166BHW6_9AGAM|nr:hypothetical protein SISSUDRAFT_1120964 [Sistotremastrum suecicum HHB10207 ss-3]